MLTYNAIFIIIGHICRSLIVIRQPLEQAWNSNCHNDNLIAIIANMEKCHKSVQKSSYIFSSYIALMSHIIDYEPSSYEEAANQQVGRDAMMEEY